MSEQALTTLVVRDEKFEVKVRVNRDNTALFVVDEWPDDGGHVYIQADTLKGVYDKLMRETKRAKVTVEVPYTSSNTSLADGVATGIHAGTGNVTVSVSEERHGRMRPDQLQGYGDEFRPLTPVEKQELRELRQKARDAKEALEAFERPLRLDVKKAVREAIKVKTDEAMAAEAKS